ncbi:hypothetical protein HDU93_008532, partial [Gonapodya sp. JEL0774]
MTPALLLSETSKLSEGSLALEQRGNIELVADRDLIQGVVSKSKKKSKKTTSDAKDVEGTLAPAGAATVATSADADASLAQESTSREEPASAGEEEE